MNKPEYISKIESQKDFFSILFCNHLEGDLLKFLAERKLTKVFEFSLLNKEGLMQPDEVIFKSQQGFYLYVKDDRQWNEENNLILKFKITIYYNVEQYTELYMFLSQLLKQYKNATTNIRGNQTKN
jgi:hypothetical protein